MNALSYLTVLPVTAAERRNFAEQAVNEILAGDRDPVQIAILLSSLEKLIADIRKNSRVQNYMLDELNKYQSGKASREGVEVSLIERKKYDFTKCEDVEWENLDAQIRSLTERKKQRETFLKYIPTQGTADPETGAMIYPPAVTLSNVITVTERRSK